MSNQLNRILDKWNNYMRKTGNTPNTIILGRQNIDEMLADVHTFTRFHRTMYKETLFGLKLVRSRRKSYLRVY